MHGHRKLMTICCAAVLSFGLAACGGGGDDDTSMMDPEPTPRETCEAADGRWNADGTCTSAAELAVERQHMAVSNAIAAAETAVDGLSATSTDAEVATAEGLVGAARMALNGADLLSANQVNALDNSLDAVDGDLVTAKADIAAHRQMIADEREQQRQLMAAQRMAADGAIDMANTSVAGLSATSTDAEVQAAMDAIQAAKDAVAAATALSMADRDALNARITPIETMLASRQSDIADHRQMVADDMQRMGVSDAINAAMAAVGALSETSTDEEVNAAKGLIADAKALLSGATSVLTAEQALALQARISTIESTLATTETAIATRRQQDADDAETKRMADVASARMMAMQSYMDADADATKAETAATEAEATAPGSQGAMDARMAATAARNAANAAKMAHDAIMDDMSKADADAQATEAATQAGNANSEYMTAKAENDTIQTAKAAQDEANRVRDIADATDAAEDAAMAARASATAARMNATSARDAADAAKAAHTKAMAARTNAEEAHYHYMKADEAATAAENAATAAEMAADAAEAAHMGIDPDGSGADAQAAQMTAETKQGEASDSADMANTEYVTAMTQRDAAVEHGAAHVLELFKAANAGHVMDGDDEGTSATEEQAAHVTAVGEAMAVAADASADDRAGSGTTATAAWPGDIAADPDATPPTEAMPGMLSLTVSPGGTAIPFETRESRAATDLNNDGDTTDDGEAQIIQTAEKIADLGVFQGYSLWEDLGEADTTNNDRARAIVFTNKTQDAPPVAASDAVTARTIENLGITSSNQAQLTKLGTKSGNTYTGAEYTPTGEDALTGTLSCPSGTTCSVDATTDGDTVTINSISGYVFTGSREAKAAVTGMDAAAQAAANSDYLVFGIWLDEGTDGTNDAFGAFAVGGANYAANVANIVTGTATYTGKAAGAHHKTGEGVNWFDGNARLTANFGAIDTDAERGTTPPADTAPGTISGEISNIRVAGGDPLSDSIVLRQAALTDGSPTFNGNARMGAGEIQDDSVEYPYNGTWSGSFFGVPADDADTTDVNESEVVPLAAAGTFGVTMTEGTGDDAVTESFVGAFGAHCSSGCPSN